MKLLHLRRTRLALLAVCLSFSCAGPEDNEFEGTVPVEIIDAIMPGTGAANQTIAIQVHAEAPNGCFKDLKVTLREVNSRHYLLRATGFFKSANTCPAVVVSTDTTIAFTPAVAGEYYFQTNEEPFTILRDTLTIN